MGNEASSETSAGGEGAASERPSVGYHVLRVNPASPGHAAGLIPFFDFIVSVGRDPQHQTPLASEDSTLVDALQQNAGRELTLGVYSSRTESVRLVQLTPRNDWGGIGLLGVSIRFNSMKNAEEQVWHVEQVYPRSPAQQAGLQAGTDYVVGTPDVLFSDEDDLYAMLRQHATVPLYLYSTVSDDIRIVTVAPNAEWGGEGVLGCELGYGLLHRIPRQSSAAAAAVVSAPVPAPVAHVPTPQIDLTQPTMSYVPHIVVPQVAVVQQPPQQHYQPPASPVVIQAVAPPPVASIVLSPPPVATIVLSPPRSNAAALQDSGSDFAPLEPAPPAPATPVRSVAESTPATVTASASAPKTLDDHKKKLAALQAQMEKMRASAPPK
jgi:hypothetical protein